jgi:hypothetical protein
VRPNNGMQRTALRAAADSERYTDYEAVSLSTRFQLSVVNQTQNFGSIEFSSFMKMITLNVLKAHN